MAREWTEETARKLCMASGAYIVVCGLIAAGIVLDARGLWRAPALPQPISNVLLWVFLAVGILFGMDRGIPREGLWSRRLFWLRRGLLVAVLLTLVAVVRTG
jgi:hypothetical protein